MGRSIKIPRFLAVVGGTGILPKAALAVPGGPWVWSLGLFSSTFFLHIHKQKKKKKKKKKKDVSEKRIKKSDLIRTINAQKKITSRKHRSGKYIKN